MLLQKTRFPETPDVLWATGSAICVELRDWTWPEPSHWIGLAESLFAAMAREPIHGNALSGHHAPHRLTGPRSSGGWPRIRTRAAQILASPDDFTNISIDTGYDYVVGERERDGFSSFERVRDGDRKRGRFIAAFSGPDVSIESVSRGIHALWPALSSTRWGAIYALPSALGGNMYAGDMNYVGPEIKALGEHQFDERYWRTNRALQRSIGATPYDRGYIKEVFEVNFLSDLHLAAPFGKSSVRDYVENLGALEALGEAPGLWAWSLTEAELRTARADWEDSGLVLSAKREPIDLGPPPEP